jgi:hypothetical protein
MRHHRARRDTGDGCSGAFYNVAMIWRPALLMMVGSGLAVGTVSSPAQAPTQKMFLLNVSAGQLPADTALDDKTNPEIVNDVKELGGKAMKVAFAPGDSFGSRGGGNSNWKRFAFFRCDAFNPAPAPVSLELTVVHARSSSYQTRVVMPLKLKPGKNEVKVGIDEMVNVNGSAPDLSRVSKWYINDPDNAGPTVYFSDIWLEGGEAPPAAATDSAPGGPLPPVGYRLKGKIGAMEIDLSLTPFVVSGSAPAAAPVHSDPARQERIRQSRMPKLEQAVMFNTPEADAIVSALEVFPPDNPWNLVVSDWPLHPNSKNIIASIGPDKPLRYNTDMGFVLVPPDQKKVDVRIVNYPSESDTGPFPVPENTPIEGWPVEYQRRSGGKVTLEDVQRDTLNQGGDRHALVVDPTNGKLYEFFHMKKTADGWQAAQSSVFDLKSNRMRREEWTSSDAAGLPVFPAVVRYDELQRGIVEHALRVTVVKTRRAYVYPARHFASRLTDENLPRMGERLRLRRDFDVSGFSPPVQAILKGLKTYGMFVADNGIDWAVSVAPDPRIPVLHEELRKIRGSDFEVVEPPPGYRPPAE